MIHELRILPEYYDAVINGLKTFEIRKDDRGYRVGDTLRLREYDPDKAKYTNRSTRVIVHYLLRYDDAPGLIKEGMVVMAIRRAV